MKVVQISMTNADLFLRIFEVIPGTLKRFETEIEALSIRKIFNHQSGNDVEEKILFRVESHVFAGEEFGSK